MTTQPREGRRMSMPNTDRKSKRTVISIASEHQTQLDFDEAERSLPFTFPEYQRELILPRIAAGVIDLTIVAATYLIFLLMISTEMPAGVSPDKRVLGIYAVCYFVLDVIYFF